MRALLISALLLVTAQGAMAQAVAAPRAGQKIRDINNARVGTIDRINRDGSVQIVVGSSFVTVPAEKLLFADGSLKVTMTKREIAKLR